MTQYLPPNLLALFAARDPLPYLAPADKLPHEKKRVPYSGVASFLDDFEDPKDTPPPTRVETRDERKERKRKERQEQHAYKLEQDLALWDPASNPSSTMDPFKTLFVARINFDTSESKLRREFEVYGAVKKICMINDRNTGKPRGYAFIEYEHERDMHCEYLTDERPACNVLLIKQKTTSFFSDVPIERTSCGTRTYLPSYLSLFNKTNFECKTCTN